MNYELTWSLPLIRLHSDSHLYQSNQRFKSLLFHLPFISVHSQVIVLKKSHCFKRNWGWDSHFMPKMIKERIRKHSCLSEQTNQFQSALLLKVTHIRIDVQCISLILTILKSKRIFFLFYSLLCFFVHSHLYSSSEALFGVNFILHLNPVFAWQIYVVVVVA